MEFVEQYRWVFIAIGVVFFFILLFKGGKGGRVVTRVTADLQVLDPRFQACVTEAKYVTFKEGQPDKIEIEIEDLPLQPGEVLDFYINRQLLSRVEVKRSLEAEFEHWSDEDVAFPIVNTGDQLDIVYQNRPIMSGIFQVDV